MDVNPGAKRLQAWILFWERSENRSGELLNTITMREGVKFAVAGFTCLRRELVDL